MNILFFMTPKASCAYIYEDSSIRQAVEKMEHCGYSSIPILTREGAYRGTLTAGNVIWGLKNLCAMDLRQAESHCIMEIPNRRDNRPVSVSMRMHELFSMALDQNFVPVTDDKGDFIGLVPRRTIIQYCLEHYVTPKDDAAAQV